jgi:hypothetical protein
MNWFKRYLEERFKRQNWFFICFDDNSDDIPEATGKQLPEDMALEGEADFIGMVLSDNSFIKELPEIGFDVNIKHEVGKKDFLLIIKKKKS